MNYWCWGWNRSLIMVGKLPITEALCPVYPLMCRRLLDASASERRALSSTCLAPWSVVHFPPYPTMSASPWALSCFPGSPSPAFVFAPISHFWSSTSPVSSLAHLLVLHAGLSQALLFPPKVPDRAIHTANACSEKGVGG